MVAARDAAKLCHGFDEENTMNTSAIARFATVSALGLAALSLTACAGMSQRSKDTAVGAGLGAVAGSVITGGTTAGAIGGAVIGGVIGHENAKK
jgi:osmotically inducible lipoprotein OsmB